MPTEAPQPAACVSPAAAVGEDVRGLHVAFVITRGDSIGGAQIHVRDLSSRLRADGATVLVLVGTSGPFTEDLDARGVRWRICPGLARSINPLRDLQAVREVHRVLLIERPQLVSTHTAKAGMVGRLAACWSGIPALFTVHGWQFAPGIPRAQRALVYVLELLLSRLPDSRSRVITVSRYDYRLARGSAAVPPRRLRLVYNGLPVINPNTNSHADADADANPNTDALTAGSPAAEPGSPDGLPKPTRVPVLTMVARFQSQKDHRTLLHAVADLAGPWRLRLVGEEGPTATAARTLAASLGLLQPSRVHAPDDDPAAAPPGPGRPPHPGLSPGPRAEKLPMPAADRRVEFLGHRRDIAALLCTTDIYCLVSNWEGLPRSIIEAMRAALPVVATDVGGVAELVQDGRTGYLVEPRNPAQLCDRLHRLLSDAPLRRSLGHAALVRYRALFTFEAMYHNTLSVWRELR
ncbi:MAG: glycosyltransferase family 1 protein [Spirochaetaceae bacterium]|nr:MAG: glycosyltransferase family 1 protein [Spirochaetaceae bacterium]